jgi:hypothetical protein
MAIRCYNGVRYETLNTSGQEDFTLELYRLRWLRKPLLVAEVSRLDAQIDPIFEVSVNEGAAPPEFIAEFVGEAKLLLQKEWEEWRRCFPEYARLNSDSPRLIDQQRRG